jgi:hypothetical protein
MAGECIARVDRIAACVAKNYEGGECMLVLCHEFFLSRR